MNRITISEPSCWRCPVCGTEMTTEAGRVTKPPTCGMGHAKREMEQITAEGFAATTRQINEERNA